MANLLLISYICPQNGGLLVVSIDGRGDILKELYISVSTLAQKLVLALLNIELVFKVLNSTPFRRKIRKHFQPKNHKSQIFAELSGFGALL